MSTIVKIGNVGEYLRDNGIKPSFQRMKIFEYLINTKEHPTVDTIYKALVSEIPTLSKTTVYNTLNLFVENEIAVVVTIEENETRYDADTSIHGHFKCENCGKVYDFPLDISRLTAEELDGFEIHHQHVYYRGFCQKCSRKH
ncbi:MAG: transcriptional repressor [Tissierellales bacterium]|nr:transcriptional repressor [Tissierellales bacterium]